jgi:hypothetical protein
MRACSSGGRHERNADEPTRLDRHALRTPRSLRKLTIRSGTSGWWSSPKASAALWTRVTICAWDIHGERGSMRWDGGDVVVMPLEWPVLAKIQRRALRREWKGRRIKPIGIG